MFEVSVVLLQNAFRTTSPFTDAWRLQDFPQRHVAYQVPDKHRVCCCSSRLWTASMFLSFDTLLLSVLCSNLARLVLFKILCCNSCSSHHQRWNLSWWFSQDGATFFWSWWIHRLQNVFRKKTALKCAKNHANWFRRFEDMSSQM